MSSSEVTTNSYKTLTVTVVMDLISEHLYLEYLLFLSVVLTVRNEALN